MVSRLVALLVVGLLSGPLLAGCLQEPDGPGDGDERFQGPDRPGFDGGRAVVAVIDSGANPYHEEFRRPERDTRAVDDLPGYPTTSHVLPLTLDGSDQDTAIAADRSLWDLTEEERLYDVPGTAFAGLIAFGQPAPSPDAPLHAPGVDEVGHGTAAAGMVAAACPDCLLVAIEVAGATEGRDALRWIAGQSWIDIVVYPARAGIGFVGAGTHMADEGTPYAWARANAEAGQVVVVAAGNGWTDPSGTGTTDPLEVRDLSYSYWTAGPDWVVTVGAAEAEGSEAATWHTYPVDILAQGLACDAPHPFTRDGRVGFEGTSCSAPLVGGQFGAVLTKVRDGAGDGATGPRSGGRLVVPEGIDQPVATREDLVRAYLLGAGPVSAGDPLAVGGTDLLRPDAVPSEGPLSPLYAGWGLHDADTLDQVVAVLGGKEDPPAARGPEADWFPVDQRVRLTLWGSWDRGDSRIAFPEPYPGPVRAPDDLAGLEALYQASRLG